MKDLPKTRIDYTTIDGEIVSGHIKSGQDIEPGIFIDGKKMDGDEYKEYSLKVNMSDSECMRFDVIKSNMRKDNKDATFAEIYKVFVGTR